MGNFTIFSYGDGWIFFQLLHAGLYPTLESQLNLKCIILSIWDGSKRDWLASSLCLQGLIIIVLLMVV